MMKDAKFSARMAEKLGLPDAEKTISRITHYGAVLYSTLGQDRSQADAWNELDHAMATFNAATKCRTYEQTSAVFDARRWQGLIVRELAALGKLQEAAKVCADVGAAFADRLAVVCAAFDELCAEEEANRARFDALVARAKAGVADAGEDE